MFLSIENDFSSKITFESWTGNTGKIIIDVVKNGCSDLRPLMVTKVLKHDQIGPSVHFVSNIDDMHFAEDLKKINFETTLFIIA
uniref:Glucose-6-phosphate isomerase (inferred by orthology to a D. melanogaster protein) n=1 Tax=Strongyloides venezuelensis TaxID=75913 RepID=A0A0K0FV72_STRVS